jgi:predicted ATPase
VLEVIAHPALGLTWFLLSALPVARQHLEEGIALYTPDQHRSPAFRIGQDPGVSCRAYAAMTLWLLGLVLQSGVWSRESEAEKCFQKALEIAQQHRANSLELRAATSLARLWQSQDKRQDATDLLAPVYGWFTEGFDTADLIEAKTLLEVLKA